MDSSVIIEGIIIGAVGGATGGFILSISNWLIKQIKIFCDKKKIYNWLKSDASNFQFRSTKSISSFTNLTYDRVNFICSIHPKIKLSTGKNEEMWEVINSK